MFRVTYAVDSLDPNPTVMEFEEEWEALDWIHEEVMNRVSHTVEHSPYHVEEDDFDQLYEYEMSLVTIERE